MRKIDKLLFGTAGIPVSTRDRNTIQGIKQVNKLKLDAMELEFVHGVNVSPQLAKQVNQTAKENNIVLTCHAPYYINLNAIEAAKVKASAKRLILAGTRASQCGAWSVAFHPGFYMKEDPAKVYEKIKKVLKQVVQELKHNNADIWIRPETTGKSSAFGDLKEICKLSQEVDNVLPCIDFAHLHARTGKENSAEEWRDMLSYVEKMLGKTALKNMHCHVAGINYSSKGELNHLNLQKSDLKYNELVKVWKEFKINGVIISESPNIEGDALLLKRTYSK